MVLVDTLTLCQIWNCQIGDLALWYVTIVNTNTISVDTSLRSAIWNGQIGDLAIILYYYILCGDLAVILELVNVHYLTVVILLSDRRSGNNSEIV